MLIDSNWQPPSYGKKIRVIDMHTGGEPLRIPIEGLPEIKGSNILEKRRYFQEHHDKLRTGILFEPRGHADMYGAILSPSTTDEADLDVFFIHNEGYSTMCGHAIIALTKFAFETGLVQDDGQANITFNVPAGTVYAKSHTGTEIVTRSSFLNVLSFAYLLDKTVAVPGIGEVAFDVAYGGAFYAIVEAAPLGLQLNASYYNQLIDYGKRIKKAVMEEFEIKHPVEKDLSFLYGTIFTGPPEDESLHSRNVCVFAEGEVDRSATGSGVSARAALLHAKGKLKAHQPIFIESILGSTMTVSIAGTEDYHGTPAIRPMVIGNAYFTGDNTLWYEPWDPYEKGFIFR